MQGYDAGVIPAELEHIPRSYHTPAKHAGTLERITYRTYDSFNYGIAGHELEKVAWVYVPYGYDSNSRYDVLYLSHGGWSNETTQMGTPRNPSTLKLAVDHAIEGGLIRPLIMVMPTYNNLSPKDSGDYELALRLTTNFHNELANDLVPAVELKYATYAQDVTPEGLAASRDHRAFGGFSMGSVNTWHTFEYCLAYFGMFMPMSGGAGWSGTQMARAVHRQGFGPEDFFIFGMSGTKDFAYSGFRSQVLRLPAEAPETFILADNRGGGNVAFRSRAGYQHDGRACTEYTYNGMRFFFNGALREG